MIARLILGIAILLAPVGPAQAGVVRFTARHTARAAKHAARTVVHASPASTAKAAARGSKGTAKAIF